MLLQLGQKAPRQATLFIGLELGVVVGRLVDHCHELAVDQVEIGPLGGAHGIVWCCGGGRRGSFGYGVCAHGELLLRLRFVKHIRLPGH